MNSTKRTLLGLAVAAALGTAGFANANTTASSIRGEITGPLNNPAVGTVVKVTHIPTGATKTATVNSAGVFNFNGLRVGGPYTIEVDSDKFADQTINDVYLTLGETSTINRQLENIQDIETISITASQVKTLAFGKVGPAVSFGAETLERAPAINRDISDIVRIDPRVHVDEGGNNSIQCNGKNPRYNSLTIDGVRQNDLFGLNSNGYPTENMPFSFGVLDQVTVELAPYDVINGGFTACNINAVTKTGTNELSGSFFYDYTSEDFRGDSLEGDKITLTPFDEKRYGISVGGPIIEDKLFFYDNYEKAEGTNTFDRGAIGSGAVNEVNITQAELDEIVQISRDLYQYDPGAIPSSKPNEDEKILVKFDWNINEDHRFALTYNYNDGFNISQADGDSDEFEFENHLYERGAELESLVGALYSDWTDKFSTEIRIISQELDNRQNSLAGNGSVGGNDFGEIRIATDDVDVYLGSDDSRQANDLDWEQFGIILRGKYYFDNGHTATFGYEQDDLEVFNLFIQHTETEIRFSSIDNFRNGLADAIYYNNAINGDLNSAAAAWSYKSHALYAQDDFYLTDDLKVVAGLRYEWYTSSDRPAVNEEFLADYGFANNATLDGEGLLQPRIGLNYTLDESTELRGGIGLFSGGNPNVWLSNNFSNTNTTQVGARGRNFCYTDDYERRAVIPCPNGHRSLFDDDIVWVNAEAGVPAGPGYAIPSELDAAVSSGNGSNFDINYLDPDFVIPSEWKISAGMTHVTDDEYVLNADVIVSVTQDQAMLKYGNLDEVGVDENGYVDYDSNRVSALALTNSDRTSTSYSVSATLEKSWDNGIDLIAGYSYNYAKDVQPMNSSVAFSNYQFRAFKNPNEDVSSLSDWNIKHRFTASLTYTVELFEGLNTVFSAYGLAHSGSPYSLTLSQGDSNGVFGFTPYLDTNNVLPAGGKRNSEESSWWSKIDLAVRQDVPAFSSEHKATLYVTIDNFTNMLNDDWGILEEANNTVTIGSNTPQSRVGDASLWSMRVGFNYNF